MQRIETIINTTTGQHLRGQAAPDGPGYVVDHLGPLSDISPGDVLEVGGQLLAILDHWPQRSAYRANNVAAGIALDSLAAIRRDGVTIAEGVQVHAETIGKSPKLQALLASATAPSTPLGRAAALRQALPGIEALTSDQDEELRAAIRAQLERHDAVYQVILRDGSGVAVGDQVSTADGLATVQQLDRQTWPGLAILTCSPVQAQAGLFSRLADRVKGAA